MKKSNVKLLEELVLICRKLGQSLDGTATHPAKMFDRTKAHIHIAKVIKWCTWLDHPDNDQINSDREDMNEALNYLRHLAMAQYTDRNGKGILNAYDPKLIYPIYTGGF